MPRYFGYGDTVNGGETEYLGFDVATSVDYTFVAVGATNSRALLTDYQADPIVSVTGYTENTTYKPIVHLYSSTTPADSTYYVYDYPTQQKFYDVAVMSDPTNMN